MKKLLVVLLVLAVMSGCKKEEIDIDAARAEQYASYIKAIQDNETFMTAADSQNYDIQLVMNQVDENVYRYDVILDNPRVAMYDIQMIAIEKDVLGTLRDDQIMPSVGILEEDKYSMMPNQVDMNKNVPMGLDISGTTDQKTVYLQVMVVWTGYARLSQNRDFFTLQATFVGDTNDTK